MGDVIDMGKRRIPPTATWAHIGEGDEPGDMVVSDMLRQITEPGTRNVLPLIGIMAPGDDLIGWALTADQAEELIGYLQQCVAAVRKMPEHG